MAIIPTGTNGVAGRAAGPALGRTDAYSRMLNEFADIDLISRELEKRVYLWNMVNKDDSWRGGAIPIPVESEIPSSVMGGGYTAASSIKDGGYRRGYIDTMKRYTASLRLNFSDLITHDAGGLRDRQTFLDLGKRSVLNLLDRYKTVLNQQMLGTTHFAEANKLPNTTMSVVGSVTLSFGVNHIDLFRRGMTVNIVGTGTSDPGTFTGTVVSVDINNPGAAAVGTQVTTDTAAGGSITALAADINTTSAGTRSRTRGVVRISLDVGTTKRNIAYFTGSGGTPTTPTVRFYFEGVSTDGSTSFLSARRQLLSGANGGAATIYGLTKSDFPALQAINISGSGATADTFQELLFNAIAETRSKAIKPMYMKAVMSHKLYSILQSQIEKEKAAFKVSPVQKEAMQYNWDSIQIMGPSSATQNLIITGTQEMDDDVVYLTDWSDWTYYSNGGLRKVKDKNNNEWYVERNTDSGRVNICDYMTQGELVCKDLQSQGVIHSISIA